MKKQILLFSVLALAACSGLKEQVGMGRKSPDEFAVMQRAPLSLPPGFELRPPEPGAPRPQEVSAQNQIQEKFGVTGAASSSAGTETLLSATGADHADPSIRRKLDDESKGLVVKDKGFIDRLLNWNDRVAPDPVVDPAGEKARIQNAREEGGPITGGDAVTIERKKKAPLENIF